MADKTGKPAHHARNPSEWRRERHLFDLQPAQRAAALKRHKGQTNDPDQQAEKIGINNRIKPRGKDTSWDRADHQTLGGRPVPFAPVRLERRRIDQHEKRKNDPQSSPRRHHQRQNRTSDKGRTRPESAFGYPAKDDRGNTDRKELPSKLNHLGDPFCAAFPLR